jgi:hypothetical protein
LGSDIQVAMPDENPYPGLQKFQVAGCGFFRKYFIPGKLINDPLNGGSFFSRSFE